jgi:uncharacterized protein
MTNNHVDYIEFGATDLPALKQFYGTVFNWTFVDYGPEYTEFNNSGVTGGFTTQTKPQTGGALVILQHDDLPTMLQTVEQNGGIITQPIFSFPGGSRFHFTDPSGNELGVWCKEPV